MKPLLSPHSSLVSCLVRKAREENISPFQVPPSRRGSETSALETHVVAGISPRSSVAEGNTPRSAPRGAPRRESRRPRGNREPPAARRPSPHRQGGKKAPLPAGQSPPAPVVSSQSLPARALRKPIAVGGAGREEGLPYREAAPPRAFCSLRT